MNESKKSILKWPKVVRLSNVAGDSNTSCMPKARVYLDAMCKNCRKEGLESAYGLACTQFCMGEQP